MFSQNHWSSMAARPKRQIGISSRVHFYFLTSWESGRQREIQITLQTHIIILARHVNYPTNPMRIVFIRGKRFISLQYSVDTAHWAR